MTAQPHDPHCIFCKIAQGQIPCHQVYADPQVLAFLDIGPLAEGHTLIVPRAHYATIEALPEELAAAVGGVIPRLSRALIQVTGCAAWNVLQNNGRLAGQAVDHVHVHLIPRREGDGLGYRWPAGKLDDAAARDLAARMRLVISD